jgi:hypothetical protein
MPRRGFINVHLKPKEALEIAALLRDSENWAPEPHPETSLTILSAPDPAEVEKRCQKLAQKFERYGRQRFRQTDQMALRREDADWVASIARRARGRRFEQQLLRSRAAKPVGVSFTAAFVEAAFSRVRLRPPQGVQRAIEALALAARARPGRPRLTGHVKEAIANGDLATSPRNKQRVVQRLKADAVSSKERLALTDVTGFRRR